jgi:hypothetical protein
MGSDRVDAALGVIEEGYAMLATESFDTQSHPELLAVQSRLEAVSRKQPAITHKLIARLTAQTSPVELGGKTWNRRVVQPVAHRPRRSPATVG